MSRLVVLSLNQGNLQDGFPAVTVQIGRADKPYQMKFAASLPPAPEIAALYRNWQSLYSAFYQRISFRSGEEIDDFEIEEGYVTNVSEVDIKELSQLLSQKINMWLNSTEFRKIDQQLRTHLKPSEEIRFIIETNDNLLRRLPWHLWNFFDVYPYGEVALSALDYQQQHELPTKIQRDKVRVLAVFGSSKGIDISQDRSFLDKLSLAAEIKFLVEARLSDLNHQLWRQGWDILFFAGHSSSTETGLLQINQTDTITLDQLKYALKQAISHGLKLAILNSCDGLGLATQLQDLHIPQVIVMREPVPDAVAQEFLRHFLAEFSSGQSLYVAMRLARERLQGLEREYPCATWLPIICQNPVESPMVWSQSELIESVEAVATDIKEERAILKPRGNTTQYLKGETVSATAKRVRNHSLITSKHCWQLLVASVLVVVSVMGVRHLGMLQPWELQSYDHLMQLRPADEKPDPRLLIVTIGEEDIQYQIQNKMSMRWSLSDQALAQLLQKLEQYQPTTIGIDIYRDFSVDPNYPNLATRLQQDQRLIALCKVAAPGDGAPDGTLPPPEVPKERLSFSDFVADQDDTARRQLLHLIPPLESNCAAEYAFSFQVARYYLNAQGIKWDINAQGNLQIDGVVFKQLKPHTSGYQAVDTSGYQLLLNYRGLPPQEIASQVSLREVLSDQVNPELVELVKNRIVLIGVTAPSTADHWKTPYSTGTQDNEKQIPGVFVQAQMVSHILSAVLDHRPLFWWCSEWVEALWVWGWSLLGGILAWRFSQPVYLGLAIVLALFTLFATSLSIFTHAGWIPLVPSALAIVTNAIVMKVLPYAHFSKSKKRLNYELK